jgi:catechol 2,3-dioxygenase
MSKKHLISQLAHVEIFSPRPAETATFFEQQIGLEITTSVGQSVYMRGWGEFYHHSIKITEAPEPGLGHIGWRTESAEALEEAVRVIEASGQGEGWIDGDQGHGRAYRFRSPDGHLNELFWEVERWQAPPELKSSLRNRPQRYIGRGAAVRRLDHVTVNASNVKSMREFYQHQLGFRYHEGAIIDGTNQELMAFTAISPKNHDLGIVADSFGAHGRHAD